MFVYGIRCTPATNVTLPGTKYYGTYGILAFPAYTRPTVLRNYGLRLSERFLRDLKQIVENPVKAYEVDLEHPYITEFEDMIVKAVQRGQPGSELAWYHVP